MAVGSLRLRLLSFLFAMNSVESLFGKPFCTMSMAEKLEVKRLGRPMPDLTVNKKVDIY